ncbi:hypothetical protein CLOM_g6457 [Closterium sp. NIES-68]|nr:hypothetical protein CLOM_g6457 [Closterium sp. NIES-68]GJP83021.1 hypothetical protein CLOP_g13232 [Closterium sp. NIES-67]GJP86835.1 hypothetical protein CLOP_g16810 [Closterium sp. NIES-67]
MALAIFDESLIELPCDVNYDASKCATSAELLKDFLKRHPNAATVQLGAQAVLGFSHDGDSCFHRTQLAASGDVFCVFTGRIDNVAQLRRSYGVAGGHGHDTSESQLVVGMYKALRNSLGEHQPISAEAALAEMVGPFSTVIYDNEWGHAFIAADGDSHVELHWAMCHDRRIAVSHDVDLLRACCPTTHAPFPPGCFFSTSAGLCSFEDPGREFRPVPHVDSSGRICGSRFVPVEASPEPVTCGRVTSTLGNIGSETDLTAI